MNISCNLMVKLDYYLGSQMYDIQEKYTGSMLTLYTKSLIQDEINYILKDFLFKEGEYNVYPHVVIEYTENLIVAKDILIRGEHYV